MFGATLKVNANWEHEKEIFFQCIMAKPEIATLLELQVVVSQNESLRGKWSFYESKLKFFGRATKLEFGVILSIL